VSLIGSPRTCRSVCDVGVRKSVWSVGVIQGLGVAVEGLGFRRDLGSGFRV
jgi:hypothetical protein